MNKQAGENNTVLDDKMVDHEEECLVQWNCDRKPLRVSGSQSRWVVVACWEVL